jgi:CHAT domain-containing protein/tetratricopeptide (TPR) repeat protein
MQCLVRLAAVMLAIVLCKDAAIAQIRGQDALERLREEGRYGEAITVLKRVIADQEAKSGLDNPLGVTLLNNLGELHYKLGLHAEAIPIYERALAIADKTIKVDNPMTAILLRNLGIVYQLQGRRGEAARLYARSILQLEKFMPGTRIQLASTLNNLATLYQDLGRFGEAEPLLQRVLQTYRDGLPAGHPYISTALNNLGRLYQDQRDDAKAEQMMTAALANLDLALDRHHPRRAAFLGNLGWFYGQKGDFAKAADLLGQAVDIHRTQVRRGLRSAEGELSGAPEGKLHEDAVGRFVVVATNLIARQAQALGQARIEALMSELFTATEWTPSGAATSLAQMAARRMTGEGPLARLVRERQDLVLEWQARDKRLIDRLSKGGAVTSKDHLADRVRLKEIDDRIAYLDRTLARDFPDFANLADPPPLKLFGTQALLKDDEALVAFIDTPVQSWVWVMNKGGFSLTLVNRSGSALAEQVAALRCGLDALDWVDPRGWPTATPADLARKRRQEARFRRCRALYPGADGGGTLPFDAKRSHALYTSLFGGIEKEVAGKRLLIVPSRSLTELPFNALVTDAPDVAVPQESEGYRTMKWLGTRQAISILPSIASVGVLRQSVRPTRASKAWIGFGNPLLEGASGDREQLQLAAEARARQACGIGPPPTRIAARGSRSAAMGDVFSGTLADVGLLRRQPPLPETSDELCDVARRLGAGDADVWLGARATETAVKSLSARGILNDYATLHFATHGLVAGTFKGMAEPALMLTPPSAASVEDDGLLTASEVTQLKLDADWVVLSACNTAAGGAEGAEALSGLARAFFYAGARSLLVTHWEVESAAAVALTTKAFTAAQKAPGIGRAEALRQSMLALIADPGSGGRNAHPSVWAPFVLVGEGAR